MFAAGFRLPRSSPTTRPERTSATFISGSITITKNKRAYDEEIAKDAKFNTAGSLKDVSVRLPSAGLSSLVDCMQFEEPLLANRRVERPGK